LAKAARWQRFFRSRPARGRLARIIHDNSLALTPGTRLGVYEVTAQIGAGGMGEVYRATDTKLKRQVAIKILPASLAADSERLARFQREAEVLASLNHPNIAAIYGLEYQERPRLHRAEDKQIRGEVSASARAGGGAPAPVEEVGPFLVMELVEGEDLSQRIEGQRAKGSGLPRRTSHRNTGRAELDRTVEAPCAGEVRGGALPCGRRVQ
jgi:serine/threonine protein kinase